MYNISNIVHLSCDYFTCKPKESDCLCKPSVRRRPDVVISSIAFLKNMVIRGSIYSNFLMQVMDEGDLIRNTSLTFHARALKNLSFERQEINLIAQIGSKLQQGESVSESYDY